MATKFIRKNGRIIPIRDKTGGPSKQSAAPKASKAEINANRVTKAGLFALGTGYAAMNLSQSYSAILKRMGRGRASQIAGRFALGATGAALAGLGFSIYARVKRSNEVAKRVGSNVGSNKHEEEVSKYGLGDLGALGAGFGLAVLSNNSMRSNAKGIVNGIKDFRSRPIIMKNAYKGPTKTVSPAMRLLKGRL